MKCRLIHVVFSRHVLDNSHVEHDTVVNSEMTVPPSYDIKTGERGASWLLRQDMHTSLKLWPLDSC